MFTIGIIILSVVYYYENSTNNPICWKVWRFICVGAILIDVKSRMLWWKLIKPDLYAFIQYTYFHEKILLNFYYKVTIIYAEVIKTF